MKILAILSLILVQPAISQSINTYGGKFTVKVGDQAEYKFSNLKNQSQDFLYFSLVNEDWVKLVNNMIFTVKIIEIKNSTYNGMINTNIIMQTIYELPNGTNIINISTNKYGAQIMVPTMFLAPTIFFTFQSKEDAISYCKQFQGVIGKDIITFTIDSNYIYWIDNYTAGIIISKYNWHTGWLQSSEILVYESSLNKTLVMRIYYSKIDNSLYKVFIENLPLIDVPTIAIIAISLLFIGFNYKRYSKTKRKIPFTKYLKKEITKKHRKGEQSSLINTDKALEMIDEIIHDSDT